MNEENSKKFVNKEVEKLLKDLLPEGLVTNFIIIAEVVSDTQQEIVLSVSECMTPWLAHGMLDSATEMMRIGDYQFPITEENNGQEY